MHAGDVYDLAQEGNELAIQIMEDAYEYLSNFISILYGVLDPDLFVLSGSVVLKIPGFIEEIEKIDRGEKIDYIRHMEYLRKNEVMLSELSQKELDQLAIHDEYDLESYKFQVLNYDIEVKDALIAEALTSLTKRKRDVILLSYFMGMSDAEIVRKMKLVRSTVNEHRKRSLENPLLCR